MTKCLFITATGTDIGKTYISALIVKKMKEYGYNCGYFKPVLSGAISTDKGLIPGDCKQVVEAASLEVEPMGCLSYCFEEAVSPHLAAERLGILISKDKILNDFKDAKSKYDYLLVEGAGGITCPIDMDKKYLLNDLIKDMDLDILMVADGGLGTINSVLLTNDYAKSKKINVQGIILNNYKKDDFMHQNNKKVIEELTNVFVVATVAKGDLDIDVSKENLEKMFKEV